MDEYGRISVVWLVLLAGIAVIAVVGALAYYFDGKVDESRQICESKGGVLLDHTVQSGKTTNHYYTCVNLSHR